MTAQEHHAEQLRVVGGVLADDSTARGDGLSVQRAEDELRVQEVVPDPQRQEGGTVAVAGAAAA